MNPQQPGGPLLPMPDGTGNGAAVKRPGTGNRRLRVLLTILLLLLGVTVGVWVIWMGGPTLPEVPMVDLQGADPEVAVAITRAQEAVLKAPRSAKAWQVLAMTLHAHNYEADAVTCYAAAGALDSHNPLWPYLQADILRVGPQPDAALPLLERAAALSPPNSLARLRLADLLLLLGQVDQAAMEFRKVQGAEPGNAHAQFGLGQVSFAQQKYEEALRHLQAVDQNPHARKHACALRAAAYQRLGNTEAADRERKLLAELPDDTIWRDEAATSVADLQVGLRVIIRHATYMLDHDQSMARLLRLLHDAVRRYPESDQVWLFLGKARANVNDLDGAVQAIQKSMRLAPGNADHWVALAMVHQAQRLPREAEKAYRKAVELRPTDAAIHFQLGVFLQEQGDNTGAAEAFRQAIRFRPDMKEAHQRLANATKKS